MKISIGTFQAVRYFTQNQIPISSAHSDPKWYNSGSYNKRIYYVDKRNIMIGIREESLCPKLDISDEDMCSGPNDCKFCSANCPFLLAYEEAINKINFNWLYAELNRVAEDVRKVTHYEGEPEIVILVYEKADNPCSERHAIKRLFQKHGIDIKDWSKE